MKKLKENREIYMITYLHKRVALLENFIYSFALVAFLALLFFYMGSLTSSPFTDFLRLIVLLYLLIAIFFLAFFFSMISNNGAYNISLFAKKYPVLFWTVAFSPIVATIVASFLPKLMDLIKWLNSNILVISAWLFVVSIIVAVVRYFCKPKAKK